MLGLTIPKLATSLFFIALLTIAPAIFQGQLANRWREPAELRAAGVGIDAFPKSLGPWELAEQGAPLTERVVGELGLAGYVSRYYRHHESGETVLLLLMVGRPGPLVRHPPDICFASVENSLQGESQISVSDNKDGKNEAASKFRVLAYRPNSSLEEPFRVAYAFTTDGAWEAPKWPRWTFGANPYLYKAHLQALDPRGGAAEGPSPLEQFIHDFVPAFVRFRQSGVTPET